MCSRREILKARFANYMSQDRLPTPKKKHSRIQDFKDLLSRHFSPYPPKVVLSCPPYRNQTLCVIPFIIHVCSQNQWQ